MSKQIRAALSAAIVGHCPIPGDKSMTHRALILGAIASGETVIHNPLQARDCMATLRALEACGVFFKLYDDHIIVQGVGLHGLQAPQQFLDLGNSGTSARLLLGLLAPQPFVSRLTGDGSLKRRPMMRVVLPLTTMGAKIKCEDGRFLPAYIQGQTHLKAIEYRLPIASAQVKSSLLLAGLYAKGVTKVIEPLPTRDHTARMLSAFGVSVQRYGACFSLEPPKSLVARDIYLPADMSSAAFFMVAACLIKGSDCLFQGVGINPTRAGLIKILLRMGADIEIHHRRCLGFEPVADIRVRAAKLKGCTIEAHEVPTLIDEIPVLMIAGCFAAGTLYISGANELRVKECDRISAMVDGITQLGGRAEALEEGAVVQQKALSGGLVDCRGDHRVAMSFAVAGWLAKNPVEIVGCDNIDTSFPQFVAVAEQLGLNLTRLESEKESHHV